MGRKSIASLNKRGLEQDTPSCPATLEPDEEAMPLRTRGSNKNHIAALQRHGSSSQSEIKAVAPKRSIMNVQRMLDQQDEEQQLRTKREPVHQPSAFAD